MESSLKMQSGIYDDIRALAAEAKAASFGLMRGSLVGKWESVGWEKRWKLI